MLTATLVTLLSLLQSTASPSALPFVDRLAAFDDEAFMLLNGIHSGFFDALMFLITGKYAWTLMYLAVVAALYVTRRPRAATLMLVGLILTIALVDSGISHYLRPALGRLRPSHPDNPVSELAHRVNDYRGGRFGFPSCHGANSFALAMFTALCARKRVFTWTIFIWAIIHSYTRLYLGVHYPGDLLVGACLGLLAGWVMWMLTRRVAAWLRMDMRQRLPAWRLPSMLQPWWWPLWAALVTLAVAVLLCLP